MQMQSLVFVKKDQRVMVFGKNKKISQGEVLWRSFMDIIV
jgi:hypothetical protein